MAVTPSGSPAWVRTVSFSDYGGHQDKRDYGGMGAINPLTDISAAEESRLYSDVAAMVRTAPFCVALIQCNDSSPAAPTVEVIDMMTGVRTTSYEGDAAPAGFPSVARNGDGDFTITFDASYDDEYSVAGAYAPQTAEATPNMSDANQATCTISGQTVVVRVWDDAGVAVADALVTVEIH